MSKAELYRGYIKHLLTKYATRSSAMDEVETQMIFDAEHDHYQLVYAGWQNRQRMYGCVLHLDIKNGKIWIQHDGTEVGIADELVKLGVPKEEIVLAFHDPFMRQYTGFATG